MLINYPQPLLCKDRKDKALTKGILNLVCSEANWSAENMIGILEGLSMLVVRGDMKNEKGEDKSWSSVSNSTWVIFLDP